MPVNDYKLPRPAVSEDPISDLVSEGRFVYVKDTRIFYVDQGSGDPLLFIHGNPTSSYLWRNVMPYVLKQGRAIAIDLAGMGRSGKPANSYRYQDQFSYLQGFIDALKLTNITFIVHDWGATLGFDYASRDVPMAQINHTFMGFPEEAFDFLTDLSRNNNKAWFDRHRSVYEAAVLVPALEFVKIMGIALQTLAPSVMAEPRVGGSLFRIQRDTRFSKDKSPYKTHVGIRLRDRDTAISSKCAGPLFYVEFDAQRLLLGVGVKEFDGRTLAAYRSAVSHEKVALRLSKVVSRAQAKGHEILGDKLRRVPRAYAEQAENELLKRKGLFFMEKMSLPKQVHGSEFVAYCRRWFEPYAPLFDELRVIAVVAGNKRPNRA